MKPRAWVVAAALMLAASAAAFFGPSACTVAAATNVPAARRDEAPAARPGQEAIVLAGGCFWGVQAVFQHVGGVLAATAGYAGGDASTAHYDLVSTGTTGHAESVRVVYDPSRVTLGQLLRVFFAVAHDPTQLDRQGPDAGPNYRSDIFYSSPAQYAVARAYIAQLQAAHVFPRPIVTLLTPLRGFYPAEGYHQDYATNHPDDLYIRINDAPKVADLQLHWPQFWRRAKAPAMPSGIAAAQNSLR